MSDWRTRLLEAIDQSEKSDREISLTLKLGPNFVNELRHSGKVPSVEKVMLLAKYLGLSSSYVVSGVDLSAADEEDLRVFLALLPEDRRSLLDLARKLAKGAPAS